MTVLGRPEDRDPFDMSRIIAREAMRKIINYAELGLAMLEDRDDDGAELARRGVVANTKAMQTAFTALAAAYSGAPLRAAQRHFANPISPVQQPEDDAA